MNYPSWGNYPIVKPAHVIPIYWRDQTIDFSAMDKKFLCYAQGKSYGDSCLNADGVLITTQHLQRFIAFDEEQGVLRCESGMTFHDILQMIVPRGWFLPVVPGTQFVSLGGAIANDIHGKNHFHIGTLGRHVKCFELLRSNGERLICSPQQNAEFFAATIGGLGLTGFITWAEIQLIPIKSAYLDVEYIKFKNLDEWRALNTASEASYHYTVAWLDCVTHPEGRGIYMRANHSSDSLQLKYQQQKWSVPFNCPPFVLNSFTIKAFNHWYFNKTKTRRWAQSYQSFFFPLDTIGRWNKMYGKRGFFQYQCVVPENVLSDLFKKIVSSGLGSFLSVVKSFGDLSSPGMLSFPKKGITLALDFPNQGQKTFALFAKLDQMVSESGGRVYPAKDACMSGANFKKYYANWEEFVKFKDPKFTSNFWQRVINE